jgi:ANTAR domain/Alanine-zipper, major outer membrane lipoprotein
VEPETGSEVQRQVDDLLAQVAGMKTGLHDLEDRADVAEDRADVSERRADAAQDRADQMEARSEIDRALLAELQADGLLSREHVIQLEEALVSSRTIGAAIGILMATRNVNQDDALAMLKSASSRSNRKMRDLASAIVAGANERPRTPVHPGPGA